MAIKKVTVIELINSDTNRVLGFAPLIEEKNCRSKMIIEDNEPLMFETRREAKTYGLEYIKPEN